MLTLTLLYLATHLCLETVELRFRNKTVERVLQFAYLVVQLIFEVYRLFIPTTRKTATWTTLLSLSALFHLSSFLIFQLRIWWFCSFTMTIISQAHDVELHSFQSFFKCLRVLSHLILHFSLTIFNFSYSGVVSNVFFPKILNQTFQFLKAKIQSVDFNMQALQFTFNFIISSWNNVGSISLNSVSLFCINVLTSVLFVHLLKQNTRIGMTKACRFCSFWSAFSSERRPHGSGSGWIDRFSFDRFWRFSNSHKLSTKWSKISFHIFQLVLHELQSRHSFLQSWNFLDDIVHLLL